MHLVLFYISGCKIFQAQVPRYCWYKRDDAKGNKTGSGVIWRMGHWCDSNSEAPLSL